ncbi:Rieske (2Fe-2S) protein [Spongiibacter taiwanensis]|uniref:Rieske (2Fe-2S) protein n=1 Tax=Spongiibacter taiwanensis TaxID=1748242 RepID=UPI002035E0F5|nr:Rieske (2Fe-2S) protein [Spongiibacter taiwanensis]USA42439.1 Rieske (2Fe-2S) protein [Spongiibacter taiwanensis]
MAEMIDAGKIDDLAPGKIHKVQHGDLVIALVNIGGEFYAVDGVCGHAGGPLCRGEVIEDEKVITCPWHGWEYDLSSGECLMDPSLSQKTYAVHVDGGAVTITVE